MDDDGGDRRLALHFHLREQSRVCGNLRLAVDPQRLAHAGDQEDHADIRVLDDVDQAVDAPVSGPVGNGDGAVVDDMDEARRIALRRHVSRAVAARRGQDQEGRERDEVAAVLVQLRDRLLRRASGGGAVDSAKFVLGAQDVVGHAFASSPGLILRARGRISADITTPAAAADRISISVSKPQASWISPTKGGTTPAISRAMTNLMAKTRPRHSDLV